MNRAFNLQPLQLSIQEGTLRLHHRDMGMPRMNRTHCLRIIIIMGIILTLVVGLSVLRLVIYCCGLPSPVIITRAIINSDNDSGLFQLVETQTAAFVEGE